MYELDAAATYAINGLAGKSTAIGLMLGLLMPDRGARRGRCATAHPGSLGGLVGAMLQDTGF